MAYIGANPVNGFFEKQQLTTDGSTTTFTLNTTIGSTSAILVVKDGVVQEPEEAYTLSGGGTSIVFASAPSGSADTYIHFLGQAIVQNLTDMNGVELILDADADTSITADTDDEIDIQVGGADKSTIKTTGFHNIDSFKFIAGTGDDLQLYHDGTNSYLANSTGALKIATETSGIAITIGHSTSEVTVADNMTVAGDLTVTGTASFGDTNITNVGSISLDTITNDGTDITLDSSGDIILDAAGNDIFFKAGGTTIGEFENESNNLIIKSSVSDADLILKGNDGGAEISALTFDMSAAGKATFNDQVVIGDGKLVLNSTAVSSTAAELNKLDGATVTVTEINILDGDNSASTVTLADADRIIVNDSGTMKQVAVSALNTYTSASIAADDVSAGDAAVTISTSSGNITIDATANDTDIIFKGTDNSSDITMLTLDGSDAGHATFNNAITSGAVITSGAGLVIADAGNIGSASDTDAIAISSGGVVTMNQIPVFSAGINVSGGNIAGTLSTAAQANITSLGTLTALTVDDVAINGKVMTMTGSSSDTAVFTAGTNGTLSIVTTDDSAAAANITITADGTAEVAGTTVTLNSSGDIVLDADGADLKFADGGTDLLSFTNSSSDVVIKPLVDTKDIIFHQYDGTSILEINDGGYARFTAAAINPEATLSDGSTVSWNGLTQPVAKVTLAGNRTMAAASGGVAGQFISLLVIQDGTGSRTLTWNAAYEFATDTAPTLTTTASLGDLFVFRYNGSKWLEVGRNLALTLS